MSWIGWWITLALAVPPEGVDPEDFGRWEEASQRALKGPEGCWVLSGTLQVDAAMHSPATAFTRSDTARFVAGGQWTGQLDDGVWTRFEYELQRVRSVDDDEDVDDDLELPVFPVIGRIDQDNVHRVGAEGEATPTSSTDEEGATEEGDGRSVTLSIGRKTSHDEEGNKQSSDQVNASAGGAEAINLLQQAIDAWDPTTATSMTQWRESDRSIELIEDFPIFQDTPRSPVVVVTSVFPEGGRGLSRLDAVFPKRVKVGQWPLKVNLMDTQFHLRQQSIGDYWLPQVEGFTLMAGVLGFTFGYEQQLVYATAQACTSE